MFKKQKTWFNDQQLQKYFEQLQPELPYGFRIAQIGTITLDLKNTSATIDEGEIDYLNTKFCKKILFPITQTGHISAILVNMTSGRINYFDSHFQNSLPIPPQMLIIQNTVIPQLHSKLKFCDSLKLTFNLNSIPLSATYRFQIYFILPNTNINLILILTLLIPILSYPHGCGVLIAYIGSRLMLRSNMWTERGLVNGSVGTVQDIVIRPGDSISNSLPAALIIKWDKYGGPTLDGEVFPLTPVTRFWNDKGKGCSRTQFPITLAWAITIHKSQGMTLEKAVADIGEKEFSAGLTYVALSRMKNLAGLAIDPPFSFDRLQNIGKSVQLKERICEEMRLKGMK
jgi:Helicase